MLHFVQHDTETGMLTLTTGASFELSPALNVKLAHVRLNRVLFQWCRFWHYPV